MRSHGERRRRCFWDLGGGGRKAKGHKKSGGGVKDGGRREKKAESELSQIESVCLRWY